MTDRKVINGGMEDLRKQFVDLMAENRCQNSGARSSYDIIIGYSGGKDSTFTLEMMTRTFQLKVLAVTFDNGFLSPQAINNIRTVCHELNIDHEMVSPGQWSLCQTFKKSIHADSYPPKALQRASLICNVCMDLTKTIVIKKAIEMGIAVIGYGWSPGQVPLRSALFSLNPAMLRKTQSAVTRNLSGILSKDLEVYLLQERDFHLLSQMGSGEKKGLLYITSPLAFSGYDEGEILQRVKTLGWKSPEDTDANSTNCLLNAFAIKTHLERFGFHPYALEISGLVRDGYMTREEGLKKLTSPPDADLVHKVAIRLGITKL
jgi:predicted PP-loop superfamily ATPase